MKTRSLIFTAILTVVFSLACGGGGSTSTKKPFGGTTVDTAAPTPVGTLSFSAISGDSITINWTAASDNKTLPADLQYKVVKDDTAASNIDTVAEAQTKSGGDVILDFTANTTTATATSLAEGTTYHFAVLVRDEAGNIGIYPVASQATSSGGALSSPTFSVAAGTYTADQEVTISAASGATICYTTNGSDPAAATAGTCSAGLTYSAPVSITATTTLRALATRAGNDNSAISQAVYTIDKVRPTVSSVSPTGGATEVGLNPTVTVTFSEAMNASSVTSALSIRTVSCSGTALTIGAPTSGDNTTFTLALSGLDANTTYYTCVSTAAADVAGNTLENLYSASWTTVAAADTEAPTIATPTISFASVTTTGLTVNWTAASDNVTSVANLQYKLVKDNTSTSNIDTINNANAKTDGDLLMDWTANTTTRAVTGLSAATTYHFAVLVRDEAGNMALYTPNSQATNTPSPSEQIAAIRTAIQNGTATTVLTHSITGGIVSYTKATVGSYAVGTADGPAFFLQNDNTGPAIMVALDPATFAGGVAPGDVINLSATEGKWLSNGSAANSSMYVITAATGSKTTTAAIPSAQNVNSVTFPTTLGANWEYESERVNASGTIATNFAGAGTDFVSAQITTTAMTTPAGTFILRMPTMLRVAKGAINGCSFSVTGAPITRFNNNTQVSAWVTGDVSVSSCPATTVSFSPANSATGVALTPNIVLTFNAPMNAATLTAQTADGACSGSIQLSSASDFSSCLALASATPTMNTDNTTATVAPAAALSTSTTYYVRVTTAATSNNGNAIGSNQTVSWTTGEGAIGGIWESFEAWDNDNKPTGWMCGGSAALPPVANCPITGVVTATDITKDITSPKNGSFAVKYTRTGTTANNNILSYETTATKGSCTRLAVWFRGSGSAKGISIQTGVGTLSYCNIGTGNLADSIAEATPIASSASANYGSGIDTSSNWKVAVCNLPATFNTIRFRIGSASNYDISIDALEFLDDSNDSCSP